MKVFFRFVIISAVLLHLLLLLGSCNYVPDDSLGSNSSKPLETVTEPVETVTEDASETASSSDLVDPKLIDQISKGMTYREVTEILGATGTDIGSGAVLFEYKLSNGKVAHIWFVNYIDVNEPSGLDDYVVDTIKVK